MLSPSTYEFDELPDSISLNLSIYGFDGLLDPIFLGSFTSWVQVYVGLTSY